MDAADKFVNNRSPKRAVLLYIIMLCGCFLISWIVSEKFADIIVRDQIKAMLAQHSESAVFTEIPDDSAVAEGESFYSAYGIKADMEPRLMKSWSKIRSMIFVPTAILSFILCTVWLVFTLSSLFGIYGSLEKIRKQCIKLSENHSYPLTPEGETFDSVRRVYDGVNVLSKRLNRLNYCLEKEKSFLGDFLTDLSHQLKTSIAIIKLNSDILAVTDNLSEDKKEQLFEEISTNITGMEVLIIEALKLAKLNADAVAYSFSSSDLSRTCEMVISRIKPLLRDQDINITFSETDETFMLNHDKIWLAEAIGNIIKNSADHAECTEIKLELSKGPLNTTLCVADNGKGIPQSEIPQMFERFGKKSRSSAMTSVGIGLSIAKKIVEAHNGEIIVYSEDGKGTRFELVFLK